MHAKLRGRAFANTRMQDVAAALFPFARKMQESLILQAKLESHVMMRLPLHATIENRIGCVNDSRSALPPSLFASVCAKPSRAARARDVKRKRSKLDRHSRCWCRILDTLLPGSAEGFSAPLSRQTRPSYLSLAARARVGHIGR
jgi:hypothetical protein